jgi:hypothetical protein
LGLNGGRGFVALLAHGFQYGRGQFQIVKVHDGAPSRAQEFGLIRCLQQQPVIGQQGSQVG